MCEKPHFIGYSFTFHFVDFWTLNCVVFISMTLLSLHIWQVENVHHSIARSEIDNFILNHAGPLPVYLLWDIVYSLFVNHKGKDVYSIGSMINGTSKALWGMRNFTKEGWRAMTLRLILPRLQSAWMGIWLFWRKSERLSLIESQTISMDFHLAGDYFKTQDTWKVEKRMESGTSQ